MSHQISKEKDMKNMKMKKVLIAFVASLGLVWVINPGSVLANEANGLSVLANGANGVRDQNTTASAVQGTPVSEFIHFTGSQHVANGVALRNRVSGTIHLRGVPAGRLVRAAYRQSGLTLPPRYLTAMLLPGRKLLTTLIPVGAGPVITRIEQL
jgi:hypothetical protein